VTIIDEAWNDERRRRNNSASWLAFAGTMLFLSGVFRVIDGLWAFRYDDEISENVQTVIFQHDPTAWGWLWVILGVVLMISGFVVVTGSQWARWFGIVVAGLAAIFNYSWLVVEPIAALVGEVLLILVIWALLAHGGDRSRPVKQV
jgi:hypothetical protein